MEKVSSLDSWDCFKSGIYDIIPWAEEEGEESKEVQWTTEQQRRWSGRNGFSTWFLRLVHSWHLWGQTICVRRGGRIERGRCGQQNWEQDEQWKNVVSYAPWDWFIVTVYDVQLSTEVKREESNEGDGDNRTETKMNNRECWLISMLEIGISLAFMRLSSLN